MAKSLYEAKIEDRKKKNKNIITDMDYFYRDKEAELKAGNPNTIDMTPSVEKPKTIKSEDK